MSFSPNYSPNYSPNKEAPNIKPPSTYKIEDVLAQYAPLIARIAAIHESNQQLREDLIQDISLSVWRSLDKFRGEASIKTFIARIAHNRGIDHVLKEKRRGDRFQLSHDDQQSHDVELMKSDSSAKKQDMQLDFMNALHKIPLDYRQAITMQLEGFSHAEIGDITGLNEATVSKRISRARKRLEQLL